MATALDHLALGSTKIEWISQCAYTLLLPFVFGLFWAIGQLYFYSIDMPCSTWTFSALLLPSESLS